MRWRTFAAAATIAACYAVPLGRLAHMWNANEMSHLMLGVALAEHRTVTIDSVVAEYDATPGDLSTRAGHIYSDKAPGLSLLSALVVTTIGKALPRFAATRAPDYWPLRHVLTWLLVSMPAAMFLVLAVGDTRVAVLLALATPLLTYSSLLFSHVPAGVLAGAAYLLVRGARDRRTTLTMAGAALAGLLAGFAVVTEYPTVILAAIVALSIATDGRKRPALPAFLLGAVLPAMLLLAYNRVAWGDPFATGYAFKVAPDQAAIHAQGLFGVEPPNATRLWGVLLSARRGLLFYCPLLLVTGAGWRAMWREDRRDAALSIGAAGAYVAFAAGFVDWEGGWSAACRHLVPLLLFLVVPFAVGLRAWVARPFGAASVAALAGASVATAILSIAVTPYYPELFVNPIAQVTARSLADGVAFPNIVSDTLGLPPMLVVALLGAAIVGLAGTAVVRLTDAGPRRAVSTAAFACGLVIYPALIIAAAPPATADIEVYRAELLRRVDGYQDGPAAPFTP